MGLSGADWELDLTQWSFRHIMQVLRVYSCSAFSLSPAFPPCSCPLAFQRQVRRLTSRISSESYPGVQEYVVSCHGAGGSDNGHCVALRPHTTCGISISNTLLRLRVRGAIATGYV